MNDKAPKIPSGSKEHACAWCASRFTGIVALLDHVDRRHLPVAA